MERSELYRECARVIDMCAGTSISPEDCVKHLGKPLTFWNSSPGYAVEHYTDLEFALAIVEGKPVFEGDVLYDVYGEKFKADNVMAKYLFETCTWTPPKPANITVTIPRPNNTFNPLNDGHALHLNYKDAMDKIIAEKAINEVMK